MQFELLYEFTDHLIAFDIILWCVNQMAPDKVKEPPSQCEGYTETALVAHNVKLTFCDRLTLHVANHRLQIKPHETNQKHLPL